MSAEERKLIAGLSMHSGQILYVDRADARSA
jgi:hypothetical protein